MHTSSQNDALLEKLRGRTIREKSEVISDFLYKYGEHASWEEWCAFLYEHQVNGFEWAYSVG